MKSVAVMGLGYVGLPLALLAESKGFNVTGVEKNKERVAKLREKNVVIDDDFVRKLLPKTKIRFTSSATEISGCDAVIICVPTPVDEDKTPDLSLVESAVTDAVRHMKKGSLLVVESTINPGVCDEVLIPLIENKSNHVVGKTIHLAHCPERINPGDPKWNVSNINRVVGANSAEALDSAYELYSKLVDADVKKMGSLKEAEAVKIVENTFRDINIAFVNELAMSFDKLGINVVNVIDGAATKPFAFMPHYPGIGVGGHCIPVDPYYLIEYARGNGFDHKFLSLARSINENMPIYSLDQLEQSLIETAGKPLRGSVVTILGLSYKANVGDDRESPSKVLIRELSDRGAHLKIFDPHLPDKSTEKSLKEALEETDAVILATAHREFTLLKPRELNGISVFLDGRNLFYKQKEIFEDAGIRYLGIGI